jgi:hypothetical protein
VIISRATSATRSAWPSALASNWSSKRKASENQFISIARSSADAYGYVRAAA